MQHRLLDGEEPSSSPLHIRLSPHPSHHTTKTILEAIMADPFELNVSCAVRIGLVVACRSAIIDYSWRALCGSTPAAPGLLTAVKRGRVCTVSAT